MPAHTPATVANVLDAVERLCPLALAEPWDNVGLLLGDGADAVRGPVLLTIDLTEAVLDEAAKLGSSVILAYHPPIFAAIKRLAADHPRQRLLLRALRAGVSVITPHTALDAAPAGMADWLADTCLEEGHADRADRRALRPHGALAASEEVKIVTFVPQADVDAVRQGLAAAGAGIIGAYEVCSFAAPGMGTFLAKPGANPAVGQVGRIEATPELRLEMVCSRKAVALAIAHLRQFHPYEEPAIDVYPLEPKPRRDTGVGRRLVLDRPVTLEALAQRVKRRLGLAHVAMAPAINPAHAASPGMIGRARSITVETIGVCPGSAGELAGVAAAEGCQVFMTGEMKHHEILAATSEGLSLILAGHTATERGYLPLFAQRLARQIPQLAFVASLSDADPLITI